MNFLDRFRYTYDDLNELGIVQNNKNETKNFNNENLRNLLSSSVKVSENLFPKIASSIDNVFKRLGVKNNFNFFITANHIQTQAACAMMPQSLNAEIIITSKMIELLNHNELQSVIGHEVSHFYYQHSLYPNPDKARNRIEYLNFLHLSRAAEISADRAGFIGSGNIENSLRSMLKISSGLGDEHINFNFSSYLDQLRELKEIKGDQSQLFSTHPTFLNRMQALIWFSMSNEYNKYFNTDKKGTFDLKNVDEKIYESIKKVIGDEVEYSNREVVSRALMWGSIDIFLSDKRFSKKEQEIFKKNFGDKSTESIVSLIKISNPKSIQEKISKTLEEASKLLKKDKEKIVNELTKLLKIVDGDKKIAENTITKIKTSLKL